MIVRALTLIFYVVGTLAMAWAVVATTAGLVLVAKH